ncbi:MAG TPA: 4Fe-4S dicluster domain-containing protein [Pseudolabrys sp.]|nr:4Fe-4S dicluster domain-containing protein [Pseudolabrys sp.]
MSPVNDLNRRAALKLLGGGLALSLTSCGKPAEEIVPYVDQPERVVPGVPLRFATTLDLSGYGRGAIVTSVEGRPIKIEGNPRHPASLGATDVFAEADVLGLYDPDRSKAVRGKANVESWEAFADALRAQMDKERARGGAGLRVVSGRVTSPTLARQRAGLLKEFPQARWISYEPVADTNEREGARLAFGRPLVALPRLKDASAVVAFDSDFLGPGPAQIVNARGFAQARSAASGAEQFLRLYAIESSTTATGANADHRLTSRPELIGNAVIAIAAYLAGETPPPLAGHAARFVEAAAADLKARQGRALVLVGPSQPPEIHALAHWINSALSAPVDLIEPVDDIDPNGLTSLAADIHSGAAETLIILDANPAYDTPPRLDLAAAIHKLPFSAHLSLHRNETAALCHWHLPLSHTLESWSDRRAIDGTASIVQPLIRPLYDTRTAHDVLAMLGGALTPSSYDIVRTTWAAQGGGDFENWWRKTLHDGVIAGTRSAPVATKPQRITVAARTPTQTMVLKVAPDPSVWDGRYANNAWLQECPKPLSKEVWGNSIVLAPADAGHLDCKDGDIAEIEVGGQRVQGPARIDYGQADGVIAISLGYGRSRAGAIGNEIGFNVYPLRTAGNPWLIDNVMLRKAGPARPVPTTQHHFQIEGEVDELLPLVSLVELAKGLDRKPFKDEPKPTFYPPYVYDTYAWAMVVDTAACIGCNACVVACQAENNVAVVGPEEIEAGRDMHWLRVDTYESGPGAMRGFQPVPCMQCEHAPCEPVCPVSASVHDSEGLNVQVYNRCVGTRFCQSNCPYKVRRFNWYGYNDGQEYKNLGAPSVTAQHNPNVTVRTRGVMEKCTYCVQRISAARRDAEKENRTIADGEVVTACQSACPTRAISFGNRNDPKAAVNKKRGETHHYELLGHLGTRPRTTYLARLTSPNTALKEGGE